MGKKSNKSVYDILVVDDHSIVRHGLSALLEKERRFAVKAEAGTYEEAEEALRELKPDILILDITLKDRNGLDLIPGALEINPAMKIVVLSMHDENVYAEKALRAGAHGYVMKENADEILVEALETVLRGEMFVSNEISSKMLKEFIEGPEEKKPAETGVEALTDRELEIFECIGQGMSTRKIADKLGLSDRTVEVHRAHIKKKLQCEDAAQVVREAVRWVERKPAF